MNFTRLRHNWDALGKADPLWAILSVPEKRGNRWDLDEFLSTGREEIDNVTADLLSLDLEPKLGRALDFGCGVGRLTQALADRFEDAWGVDIAPSMIELADRYNRHPETCHYVLNDHPDLRVFDDEMFDFIYSNITLQHMEPQYQGLYLAELVRVLAPGGLLVFQLPSRLRDPDGTAPPGEQPAPRRGVKHALTTLVPHPLVDIYRRALRSAFVQRTRDLSREWRARRAGPRMEMWGTPREEVEALIQQHGGTVLDAKTDEWAPDWVGFRYTVTKG